MDNTLTIDEVQSLFNAGCDYSCFYHCTINGQQKPSCLKNEVVQNCSNCKYEYEMTNEEPCINCKVIFKYSGNKNNWEDKQ